MYAYCGNNPVMSLDCTGELAFPGQIQNEVVKHLSNKYGFYKEKTILYNFGWGRADLMSQSEVAAPALI